MRKLICFCIIILTMTLCTAQTIREFKRGAWGMFPWVEPNSNEQDLLEESNVNHINAWILNKDSNVYPDEYEDYYDGTDGKGLFDNTHIRWLEREWMDYFNSTFSGGDSITMYLGCNGFENDSQWSSQIEAYAEHTTTWSNFITVVDSYYTEFGDDVALDGYYISHEDIKNPDNNTRITNICNYIRDSVDSDLNHELVIEHWDTTSWVTDNTELFDIFEITLYRFESSEDYASADYQNNLDTIIWRMDNCRNAFHNTNTDWHAIIQTYGIDISHTPKMGSTISAAAASDNRRWPTKEEIWASAYLSLTQGARGIKSFLYGSYEELEGLLQNSFTSGIRSKTSVSYESGPENPFDFVAELYDSLKVIGPVISDLEIRQVYTATNENSTRPDSADVSVTADSGWIEAGVFDNRVHTSWDEIYVLLVNRVCNDGSTGAAAPSQTLTVTLNDSPASGERIIEDVYNTRSSGSRDQTAILDSDEYSFQISLNPGEGRLYKINYPPPAVTISGTVVGEHPRISWTATSGDIEEYEVWRYRTAAGGGYVHRATVAGTTYTDNSIVVVKIPPNNRVYYKVKAVDYSSNESDFSNIKWFYDSSTSKPIGKESEDSKIPKKYSLSQNYPNPFNPMTMISFDLPEESSAKISVYNINGEEVFTLGKERLPAGSYNVKFDASKLASGVYFYRLVTEKFTDIKRMLVIK